MREFTSQSPVASVEVEIGGEGAASLAASLLEWSDERGGCLASQCTRARAPLIAFGTKALGKQWKKQSFVFLCVCVCDNRILIKQHFFFVFAAAALKSLVSYF